MAQQNFTVTPIQYLRINEVIKICGLPKSSFYEKVKLGLMPPAVSLGQRAVAWVNFEIDAVNKALLAGATEDEIKALVVKLVEQRQQAA